MLQAVRPMLESLTDRMSKALRNLRGVGKLSERNVEDALKEVRSALLSADVHFKVVREFIEEVKNSCLGQDVLKSVSPGQQIVKIIHELLVELLGEGASSLSDARPLRIVLAGLHGAGKTTTAAKLAKRLAKEGRKPFLVACDVYRPAAIDQLETLAREVGFPIHLDRNSQDVKKIARDGWEQSKKAGADLVIFDTAGRLQIDEDLVDELRLLKREIDPHEILLVADSALGQEAVNVAKTFHEALGLTGLILTKVDGDARGGAALSMKKVTDLPIKFMGTGEKTEDFDLFHPDRIASRILGMGDVVSLVEKAQETIDQEEAARMAEKIAKADFDFGDFLSQIKQMKKLGSMGSIAKMLPGMGNVSVGDNEDALIGRHEAIILSMTREERACPRLLNGGSRRMRLADGAGVKIKDVNALLKQFSQMQKMMKKMRGGKMRKMLGALGGGMGGGGGMPNLEGMDQKELAKLAKKLK